MPRQPKAYKTFDHLPMKQLLALNCDRGRDIHGYKRDDVAKEGSRMEGRT